MYSYSYISRQGLVAQRMLSYLFNIMSPRMLGFNLQFIQTTMLIIIIRMPHSRPADGVGGPILKRRTKITKSDEVVVWWLWCGCHVGCVSHGVRLSYETLIMVLREPIIWV